MKTEISPELAEICGIFCADGCLQKAYVCIWGNITEDREYYDNHLTKIFLNNFGIILRVHEKTSNSVYGFYTCDRKIGDFFNNLGFKPGNKTYTMRVPKQIRESEDTEVLASFLRGFADGDGCLNFDKRYGKYIEFKRKYHNYPRIQIKCVAKILVEDMCKMLDKLGIKYFTRLHKRVGGNNTVAYSICVEGCARVEKWIDLIGFKNPVYLTKYKIWKRYGFVPPNTSIK